MRLEYYHKLTLAFPIIKSNFLINIEMDANLLNNYSRNAARSEK